MGKFSDDLLTFLEAKKLYEQSQGLWDRRPDRRESWAHVFEAREVEYENAKAQLDAWFPEVEWPDAE